MSPRESRLVPGVVVCIFEALTVDTRGLQKLLINTDDEYTKPRPSKEFRDKGKRRVLLSGLVTSDTLRRENEMVTRRGEGREKRGR